MKGKEMTRILFLTTAILTALGPTLSYASAQHGVPWYLANRAALQSELTACTVDPGDLASTPDCINAKAAQQRIAISTL
jgi:hypothetical protein